MNIRKILLSLLLTLSLLLGSAFAANYAAKYGLDYPLSASEVLVEDGLALTEDFAVEYGLDYSSPEEVGLYLYAFQELPPNFITKSEARKLGWDSSRGNLWDVAYGYSIGGDSFGNREGLLPESRGRDYFECDVNYAGGYRGGERIVYSNDGLIYYTGDHYESFIMLYDGWYEGETYGYSSDYDYGYSYKYVDDSGYDDYDSGFGTSLGDLLGALLG